jgi:branched-chain amino acid transport system ATP-binding protein
MGTLDVENVSVARAGRIVVREVSLSIPSGAITALLGANGAGKSSLVAAVAGILPHRGRVRMGTHHLTGLAPSQIRALGVATVPEGHRVLRGLSVTEGLAVAGSRLSKSALSASLAGAWELFPELSERRHQEAGSLSGGQQQMLAMASALIDPPSYLLIDEMSLGLAPVVVKRLLPVLQALADRGIGVLLVEQFATAALAVAQRAAVMDGGSIVFDGSSDDLVRDPTVLHRAYLAT